MTDQFIDHYEDTEALRLYFKALRYADIDPEVSMGLARRSAESVLIELATSEHVMTKPTLENLLTALTSAGKLPMRIVLPLRTIQGYGNYGVHAHGDVGETLTTEEIQPCLRALSHVLRWHGDLIDESDAEESRRLLVRANVAGHITRIADSTLIVVKAILLGWRLERLLARYGRDLTYVQLPWADGLVRDVAEGLLETAVYNEKRTESLCSGSVIGEKVTIVGRFGHSMGGRNFYLLAARDGKWGTSNAVEFLEDPQGASIAVPEDSDMFANLLVALNTDKAGLRDKDIEILDVPHHLGLEIFHLNKDVLVVGGQNLRMHARVSGRFFELLNCEMLTDEQQRVLWESAANVMVANTGWLSELSINPSDLHTELMRNFLWSWATPTTYEDRVRELAMFASFPPGTSAHDRERLVRHVLYETYRFGEPS